MTRYLLSVHSADVEPREPMTGDQMREGFAAIGALEAEMRSAGALVFSGRLTDPGKARVVRMKRDRAVTTDGPYLEAKEVLGGFYIIEADDLDAALAWASKTTAAVGMPIEVRPFWRQPAD